VADGELADFLDGLFAAAGHVVVDELVDLLGDPFAAQPLPAVFGLGEIQREDHVALLRAGFADDLQDGGRLVGGAAADEAQGPVEEEMREGAGIDLGAGIAGEAVVEIRQHGPRQLARGALDGHRGSARAGA
jgi:hypothetical protein